MLMNIYVTILHLASWTYSPDISTLRMLDNQIKNMIRNLFARFYHDPLMEQFQVGRILSFMEISLLVLEIQRIQFKRT